MNRTISILTNLFQFRTEIESTESHQNLLTVSTSNANDDRHTRHITHDDRLISSVVLRRHFEHLVKNDQRWEGGSIGIHDDQVLALISHAAEERMKYCLNRLRSLAEKRVMLSTKAAETEKSNEVKMIKRKIVEKMLIFRQTPWKSIQIPIKTIFSKNYVRKENSNRKTNHRAIRN